MSKHVIQVEGMSCAHCKAAVEGAVKDNPDVVHVEAFPADNKVEVDVKKMGPSMILSNVFMIKAMTLFRKS